MGKQTENEDGSGTFEGDLNDDDYQGKHRKKDDK